MKSEWLYQERLAILLSPGFVLGLSLLLLNDFVLKLYFHNALTGKLSDFAGLFVFPLFWLALFPRSRRAIYILTAVLFLIWKSPYSQPIIDGWNRISFISVERTSDYTDLVALLVLPASYGYAIAERLTVRRIRPFAFGFIGIISIVAFTATSYRTTITYQKEYSFAISRQELLERMSRLPTHEINPTFPLSDGDEFEVIFDSCTGEAKVSVVERNDRSTVVTLEEIDYRCPRPPGKPEMLQYFEKEFINKLNEDPVVRSPQVEYIWSIPKTNTPQQTPSRPAKKT